MAKFEISYKLTNQIEGGYANDPDDSGGETYRGIARKSWPNWLGWKIIDAAKAQKSFPNCLDTNEELQQLVEKFYYENFWLKIKGDNIPQPLADELYDTAVNTGVEKAVEYLQRTLNILNINANKNYYPDLQVDRLFGPGTLNAVNVLLQKGLLKRLVNVLNGYQIKHYIEIMEKNPTQEKYVGWFDRVRIVW